MPITSRLPSRPTPAPGPAADRPATPRRAGGSPSVLLGVVLTAQLMVVLDTTIVNVALPHIQQGLGFTAGGLSWVLNAYVLTFGGLLLLGARVGDLLGRRVAFLAGIALFTASSLAGGLAVAGWMLLAARAVQGAGAALAAPSALSLLTDTFAEGPARVRAIALYTAVSAAGGATGLVAGGLLTDLVSWRWVMYVNVPIGVAVWLVGRRVVPAGHRRPGRFDLSGAVTSTAGMSAIVFGLVEAGTSGWGSPRTIVPIVAGASSLAWFVHHEHRADQPVLPLRLLTHATRSSANLARALLYAGMYGMFFFLSQYFQDVQGYSPLLTGAAFLPMPASVFLGSQLTSRVLVRRLPGKMVMMGGAAVVAAGLATATLVRPGTSYLQIVGSMVLIGAGMGISFVSLTSASLSEVAPEDAGAASGLVNVSQQLGGAVGLAVLVTVFTSVADHARLAGQHAAGAHNAGLLAHGLDEVFAVGALLSLAALAMVGFGVRSVRPAPERSAVPDLEPVVVPIDVAEEPARALECEAG